jgi:23S rRNA (guanosine2251-2'-O)-methyltransferase
MNTQDNTQPSNDSSQYIIGKRAVVEALHAERTNAKGAVQKVIVAYGIDDESHSVIRLAAKHAGVTVSLMDKRKFLELEKSLNLERNEAQGVLALTQPFSAMPLDVLLAWCQQQQYPFLVALDGIMDPGNLGAILRSAEASGASGIIVPSRFSAPISPAVVRASAGALAHLKVSMVPRMSEALKQCKHEGFFVAGAHMDGNDLAANASEASWCRSPLVIVMGNEGQGLHPSVQAQCHALVRIPMHGKVSSLNVSVAAGILCTYASLAMRSHD